MGVGDLEDVLHRGAWVDDAQARVALSHLEKCAQCGGVEEGHLAEVDVEGVPVEDGEPWLDRARGGEVAFASMVARPSAMSSSNQSPMERA